MSRFIEIDISGKQQSINVDFIITYEPDFHNRNKTIIRISGLGWIQVDESYERIQALICQGYII